MQAWHKNIIVSLGIGGNKLFVFVFVICTALSDNIFMCSWRPLPLSGGIFMCILSPIQ
jgi:hypothetical protein